MGLARGTMKAMIGMSLVRDSMEIPWNISTDEAQKATLREIILITFRRSLFLSRKILLFCSFQMVHIVTRNTSPEKLAPRVGTNREPTPHEVAYILRKSY